MWFYKNLIRPIFFLFDPEKIHYFTFRSLKFFFKIPFSNFIIRSVYHSSDQKTSRVVMGIKFPNPIGLAAGFDKDAKLYSELSDLGFGFIEVGTVTPLPQLGNPRPRLFRLPKDESIINRMGFNNKGIESMVQELNKNKNKVIIGGNIGKNKITTNENAHLDYESCFEKLFPYVDYFAVNVSSPNTPGLRALQEKEPLLKLLLSLQKLNLKLSKVLQSTQKPILLKIAPDLTEEQLLDIIEVVNSSNLAGVIATNTTISRQGLKTNIDDVKSIGEGGLSGRILMKKSTDVIHYLRKNSKRNFTIIGVGGIHSPQDAIEKMKAGADLIQLYTGFIYEGPGLIKKIKSELIKSDL